MHYVKDTHWLWKEEKCNYSIIIINSKANDSDNNNNDYDRRDRKSNHAADANDDGDEEYANYVNDSK